MAGKLIRGLVRAHKEKKRNSLKKGGSNSSLKKVLKTPKRKAPEHRDESRKSKVVDASELNWKTVDIPDTMDDYGGFYGLEEIDGVDVKIVDGNVRFIATDQTKSVKPKPKSAIQKDDVLEDEDEKMDDVIEFKNMDDMEEGELSTASSGDAEESDEESNNKVSGEEEESEEELDDKESVEAEVREDSDVSPPREQEGEKGSELQAEDVSQSVEGDELESNVFGGDFDIDNIEPGLLPEWTDKMNLSLTTLQGLAEQYFMRPTEIQAKAIPVALSGNDIMGKASTGSGKTLAYGIPILEKLVADKSNNKTIGLIFTPTRELAQQVTQHIQKLAFSINKKNPYAIVSLTGGLSIQKQERLLKYDGCARVVIATPGRFMELLERDAKLIDRFSKIDYLVLDEADRLLQDGHFDEFEKILKHLSMARNMKKKVKSEYAGTGWQTMIFSATFSMDLFNKLSSTTWKKIGSKKDSDEMEIALKHLMSKINFRSKPVIIDVNPDDKIHSKISESMLECLPTERDLFTYYFLTVYPGSTLIFCNAIDSVKKLNAYLNFLGISSFQIHSSMTQKNRLKNLEKYQQQAAKNKTTGGSTVLIASDVAARGLDVPDIKHVLNYHLPRSADVYIHRSGRTARGDNEGVSVMICSPQEAMGPLRKLRKVLASKSSVKHGKKWQKDVPVFPIEPGILSQLRERGAIAHQLAEDQLATRSLNKDENWLKKAAGDLGIELDSDDESKDIILAKNKFKKQNKQLRKGETKNLQFELRELLKKPIRKDLRTSYLTGGFTNLADDLIKNKGHASIIGHDKIGALELLKNKKKTANSFSYYIYIII
ncbi:LANO_0C04214g1_1 [Lachancea nothofagi CBS 11611]|uniref:RNA helicase n=1 Tax=Lachancea nothofagi CBS 11611 TaxID=1266666 RepID=A0A1G4J6D7_9SACH|nr:LANO_0C04214g1_1 [Lachancea nothofagi CBS 11611]